MDQQDEQLIERERSHFKHLLASNPNYFNTTKEGPSGAQAAAAAISGNTRYEEIGCVGYNPVLDLLEATVQIKRPVGYGGDLCSPGTTEFIRFYVDIGGGWVDAGVTSFKAHDIPDGTDCAKASIKPIGYAVSLPFAPRRPPC